MTAEAKLLMGNLRQGIINTLDVDPCAENRKTATIEARCIFVKVMQQYFPGLGVSGLATPILENGELVRTVRGDLNTIEVGNFLGVSHSMISLYQNRFEDFTFYPDFRKKYRAITVKYGIAGEDKIKFLKEEIIELQKELESKQELLTHLIQLRYEEGYIPG
jgi:hypothetical protein